MDSRCESFTARLPQQRLGDAVGAALGLVEVAEPDHRHLAQLEHGGGQNASLARDQLAVVGNHAGYGPVELRHAGCDLRHLVVAVQLGVSGVGAQPVDWPALDLARREGEVHGAGLWRGAGRT